MNTNKVFVARVFRVIDREYCDDDRYLFTSKYSRETLVYEICKGKFYDLLAKKMLITKLDNNLNVGDEHLPIGSKEAFKSPFNEYTDNTKQNLSRAKVKSIYFDKKIGRK